METKPEMKASQVNIKHARPLKELVFWWPL